MPALLRLASDKEQGTALVKFKLGVLSTVVMKLSLPSASCCWLIENVSLLTGEAVPLQESKLAGDASAVVAVGAPVGVLL